MVKRKQAQLFFFKFYIMDFIMDFLSASKVQLAKAFKFAKKFTNTNAQAIKSIASKVLHPRKSS